MPALLKIKSALRNLPLVALTVVVSFALAAFEWAYIWMTNHASVTILGTRVPLAFNESIIITCAGLLALVAGFVAAERRMDPRPSHRAQAGMAQTLAILLLLPGINMAANSFAYPTQVAEARSYLASAQYQTDMANSRDHTLDSMTVRDAADSLGKAIAPTEARFDLVAWIFAAFLYGTNLMAASFLWRAKPETPAERKRRETQARAAQARRARERLKVLEVKANAQAKGLPWLRVLNGDKQSG